MLNRILSRQKPVSFAVEPIVGLNAGNKVLPALGEILCRPNPAAMTQEDWRHMYKYITNIVSLAQETHPSIEMFTINLDTNQIIDDKIFPHILNLPQNKVIIEWTEAHASQTDVLAAAKRLRSLQKSGFQIALDDFGCGEDGLGRMCHIEPMYVKLAGSIMVSSVNSPRVWKIIKVMVNYMHRQGIKVIAEKISIEKDIRLANYLNADYGQGYFWPSQSVSTVKLTKP